MLQVCGFHVITQALLSYKNSIGAPAKSSEESAAIAKYFKGWLYSWLVDGGIENEAEYVTSKQDLFDWLDSKKVKDVMGESWCANATRFVNKSIVPYEDLTLSYLFSDQASFGMYTSSIAESAHSSNKAGSQNSIGCRPCDPLDESLRKINNKAHVKMNEMLQNEAKSTILTPTWSKSNTAGKIIPDGECLLQERSIDAERVLVYRKDEFTWLCMTDRKRQKRTVSPITAYQRCYEVSYKDGCLVCNCKKYRRFGGMPCPEQVAILKTGICLEHIGVRLRDEIDYLQNLHQDITEELVEMRQIQLQTKRSRTPIGQLMRCFGVIFFGVLLIRIGTAVLAVLRPAAEAGNAHERSDPITKSLSILIGFSVIDEVEYNSLQQLSSLLLSTFLSFSQVNMFLKTMTALNRRIGWLWKSCWNDYFVGRDQNNMLNASITSWLLSGIMGSFFLCCLVLTKMNMPRDYRASFSAALKGSGDFSFDATRTTNSVFAFSCIVSAAVLGSLFGIRRKTLGLHLAGTSTSRSLGTKMHVDV